MNILEKIRQAEQQAAEIRQKGVADARDFARESLASQNGETQAIRAKAQADAEALREKAGADAAREADAFIEKAGVEDARRIEAASVNLGGAVERIVKEVRAL
ncbi:MAG: hypothetical protein VB092_08250 [Oscillospiraceae bacterium]|nr:hypothetical protein [Oscillospiraceae bacterium]